MTNKKKFIILFDIKNKTKLINFFNKKLRKFL